MPLPTIPPHQQGFILSLNSLDNSLDAQTAIWVHAGREGGGNVRYLLNKCSYKSVIREGKQAGALHCGLKTRFVGSCFLGYGFTG